MNTYDILLNNSDPGVSRMIEWALKDHGQEVTAVYQPQDALRALQHHHFDVVLTDITSNPDEGLAVVKEAKKIDPETIVILLGCREAANLDMDKLPTDADEVVFAPCGTPKLWNRLANCLERMELRRRDAHCRDGRRHLLSLAAEMRQLRNGDFGNLDDGARAKVSELTNEIEAMIASTDEQLAAGNSHLGAAGTRPENRH